MSKKPAIRAEICDECLNNQKHHPLDDGQEQYYCPHNEVIAVRRKGDPGWQLTTCVSPADYAALMQAAEKVTTALLAGDGVAH